MKPEEKQALELQAQGLTRQQIGDRMGKTVRQVKSLLERARLWQRASDGQKSALEATGLDFSSARHGWRVKVNDDGSRDSVFWKAEHSETSDDLLERVADAFKDIPAYESQRSEFTANDLLTVYPLYDLHVGMLAWSKETGSQDYDLDHFQSDLMQAIETVSSRSPASETALVIFGGDTLHVDDYSNETPTGRNKMDADGRFEKITDVAIHAMTHAIESLLQRHAKVKVVVLVGNHDQSSHIILKAALKQRYRKSSRIEFVPSYRDVFWMKHGKTLIFAHHGDKMRPERLAMIVADQCPHWSDTRYRVALTGHLHSLKVQDFPGVTHYTLRAFAPADAYGASFGGVRGITAMTFSEETGLTVTAHDPIEREV